MAVNLPQNEEKENADLKELIEKNIAVSEEIQKTVQKIWRHLWWASILGVVKWLIILMPIVAAWIYLPQLINAIQANPEKIINSFMAPYIEGIIGGDLEQGGVKIPSVDQIPEKYKSLLK